ncbi:peptide chain release factor 1 [Sediminispirochaeta smaragdinae]|jgi:peptide chain release factor 1|uniref:Peptide chain release factor 1 n=1 Tax=Sediminispirochaeta smaragdinae (strain DSM 11293 / JCM 15392 / SEBR 4228) TaxID=573413 RepID=E1R4Q8_SEDSS|nr:peptide chain release factor 1 [Sediminispirochaeta smaragdinae]ADK82146.1 peptide chain release factor 1 [Sediminispirochaeta smaragdinae DSM 11293]
MIDKLESIASRFTEIEERLGEPDTMKDMHLYKELSQEHAALKDTVEEFGHYKELLSGIEETKQLLESESDHEMREMAEVELEELKDHLEKSEKRLKTLLVPKDPLDGKNTIIEIRAGTGGDEASLFAADLYRMYSRFSEQKGWKLEMMESSDTEVGGFKEVIFSISGKEVYGNLRYESGVHRVQRVPSTESQGRIHTSAVTVAVLPEAEKTDIDISPEDLKIDVFRSSGPGGQSVNTTDSAVRVTHIPTGVVVTCQDEKSQLKNKAKALRVLRARLYEAEEMKQRKERDQARKSQIGSGDRSERIRTYNFPQNRVTDHRINLTLYKLDQVMEGALNELIDALKLSITEELLKQHA